MERVVSVEAVVLNETKHSDLVLVFAVLGILHDVPCLRDTGRRGRSGRRGRGGEGGGEEGKMYLLVFFDTLLLKQTQVTVAWGRRDYFIIYVYTNSACSICYSLSNT